VSLARHARRLARALALPVLGLAPAALQGYPLDGYQETGIRRVEGARLVQEGVLAGRKQPPGALLGTGEVDLRLLQHRELRLPEPDPGFTAQVVALLGEHAGQYGVAVLDLTDPAAPVYAEHRGDYRQNVGSVGKLLGALGLFQALADTWPDDLGRRRQVLLVTVVIADDFSHYDHHSIRLFDVGSRTLTRRAMQDGDRGSLWEYLDWTLSVSSNSAAAMVMRDAMLLRRFGTAYPVPDAQIAEFFAETPPAELTALFQRTFWEPVTRHGLALDQLRQGSFFTAQGKKNVNGGGLSYATARTLLQLMLLMEQGRLVDEWSSRQLKRLLYQTEHRIRYASSPELRDAAVYFKSGSLYRCTQKTVSRCGAYLGDALNYMNSVAIVEQVVEGVRLHYVVVVISNVLEHNSAADHQALGTAIHRLVRQRHPGGE